MQTQHDLEGKIYRLSGDNKLKQDDKDNIMMLIPELYRHLKKDKRNCLRDSIERIQNDHDKKQVTEMLKQLKVIYG